MLLKNKTNSIGKALTVSAISVLFANAMFTLASGPVIGGGIKQAMKITPKMTFKNVIGTVPIISTVKAVASKE